MGTTVWLQENSDIVLNTRQKVRVVFLAKKESLTVKLVEPTEPTSPISAYARAAGDCITFVFAVTV